MVRVRAAKSQTRVNYSGYTSLQEDIRKGLIDTTDSPRNPYSIALRRWGELYREFLKRRYNRLKAGGGEWAPIAKSTEKWRKQRHGITHRQILYVTRSLYKTTNKKYGTSPGQYEKRTKYGITVGVSAAKHPDARMSYRRLVKIHAEGSVQRTVVPVLSTQRIIYVPAGQPTRDKMNASMRRAHQMVLNKANKQVKPVRNS